MSKLTCYSKFLNMYSVIFINLFSTCKLNVKIWNSNFDYQNSENWNLGRIPCSNDRIIFAENSVIYLDQQITAKEIILPKNGQIVFGDKASISLVESNVGNGCDGNDIEFSPKLSDSWFDPYKWNQTIDVQSSNQVINELKFVGSSEEQNPVPHMERIPCINDSVVFAVNTSFKVNIDLNSKITIKSLDIWDKSLDNDNFRRFTDSDVGQQLFSLNHFIDNFDINPNMYCNDNTGCLCGNEEPLILAKICKSVSKYGCPSLQCSDPIRPVGHCCDICASMLTIAYKSDFNLDLIQGITTMFQIKAEYMSVSSYLHKLKANKFQFIAIDLGQKGLANRMVNSITKYFNDDIYLGPGIYALSSIDISSSTQWNTSSSAGVWLFTIFLIFILIASIVAVSYYLKKKRITTHFAFARFHGFDSEDAVELQMGTTPHEALDPNSPMQMSTSDVRSGLQVDKDVVTFENPVFLKHSQSVKPKDNTSEHKSSELTSVENPFFSTDN